MHPDFDPDADSSSRRPVLTVFESSVCMYCVCLLTQSRGVGARWRQWPLGLADIPSAADTEGRPLPACTSLSTRRHVAHDGQRRHVLCSPHPFHLHL